MRTRPFTELELYEVMDFLNSGFDTSILFEYDFNFFQTIEILIGFQNGIDVSSYAKPEILSLDMADMRNKLYKDKQNEN